MKLFLKLLVILICTFALNNCRKSQPVASYLKTIYSGSAQHGGNGHNPVILIPGIMGSKLIHRKTGEIVWGAYKGNYINPSSHHGISLFALPIENINTFAEQETPVISNGVLDSMKVNLFGLTIDEKVYLQIMSIIGIGGYRDESLGSSNELIYGDDHFTCFQFDYDWRKDNVENAIKLHQFILKKQDYVRNEYSKRYGIKNAKIKFDIVAHSMGGLIARYYLMYGDQTLNDSGELPQINWKGSEYIDQLIMVGTPNAGSIEAFYRLTEGLKLSSILPKYEPALIGTFPSVYQLLPRERHHSFLSAKNPNHTIDIFDVNIWEKMKWGLLSQDQIKILNVLLPNAKSKEEQHLLAKAYLSTVLKRAKRFMEAIDQFPNKKSISEIYLFAGDSTLTPQSILIDTKKEKITISRYGAGDGTVLRTSALMDERMDETLASKPYLFSPINWHSVNFFLKKHMELMDDSSMTDNLLYLLLEKPRYQMED